MLSDDVRASGAATVDLSVTIAGIRFPNPVLTASGTFGYGEEYSQVFDVSKLGGIIVKGTSLEPSHGNPPPRVVEVCGGTLCSIGLHNIGVRRLVDEKMPFLRRLGIPVIVNIAGRSVDEFVEIARILADTEGIAGVELNVSCPNVRNHGMAFGVDAQSVASIVSAVRDVAAWPVFCKLTPNVTDIVSIARSAEDAGADGLSLINGPLGMAIDVYSRRPKLGNGTGGLTGPLVKPIAVRMVWEVATAVDIPVIGVGGIVGWEDAAEFLIAGAQAVEVGTGFFYNPLVGLEIVDGLRRHLEATGVRRIGEMVGSLVYQLDD